ncbi:MAG: ABC transporter ATP-binding protein [Gemmatimonadota bacterium]|nr:ABC transporter ATP-binding protein [Gemmatimonadota bacterium]MDE2873310.1 ABC transporter ATP-binding protein [Gemmatimonadota bacterium]
MDQLKTVLPYFRPYRAAMFWGLVLVIVANAFSLASPYLLKLPIDALTAGSGSGADPDGTRRTILTFALLIVGAAVLGNAARYGMREILNGLSRRIEVDLRNDFLRHLLRLDAGFYGRTRTGDLMSLATNDTLAVRQAVGPAVMYSVNTLVNFAFGLGVMIWISPRLTLAALLPLALLPPVVLRFGRAIHTRFERIQEQFAALSTMVQENLAGVRIVRAYGQETAQEREFDAFNREYVRRNMHLAYVSGAFHPIMGLLTGAGMVVVLWYGGRLVMSGAITTGDFVAFSFYLVLLGWPMIALGWVVNLFQRGAASMGRINRIMATEPAIAPPAAPHPPPTGDAAIEFRNVCFRYPGGGGEGEGKAGGDAETSVPEPDRLVLEDISFTAEPGRTVAIVGPTGSGKSTLVSLLARVHDPTSGAVLLDGVPLPEYDPADIRARIGFAPQDGFLFSARLGLNIGLGVHASLPADERDRRIRDAAAAADLHETAEGFPDGYRTRLGERGINLSGGQKQRATLARALAIEPAVLVLDDVLSAVDTATESRILEGLRRELRGRTAFIISHRVTAVKDADLILVLDGGRIVERGRHEELLARRGTYASLLRRQLLEQDLAGAA